MTAFAAAGGTCGTAGHPCSIPYTTTTSKISSYRRASASEWRTENKTQKSRKAKFTSRTPTKIHPRDHDNNSHETKRAVLTDLKLQFNPHSFKIGHLSKQELQSMLVSSTSKDNKARQTKYKQT